MNIIILLIVAAAVLLALGYQVGKGIMLYQRGKELVRQLNQL